MATFMKFQPFAVLTALSSLLALAPTSVFAQDERLRVSFAPSVATVSGNAEFALGGTIGYRVSRQVWFEGDVTWIDGASGVIPNVAFPVDPYLLTSSTVLRSGSLGGPVAALFGNRRLQFPSLPFPPIDIGRRGGATDGSTFIGTMGIRWEMPVETEHFRPYVSAGFGLNFTDQQLTLRGMPPLSDFFGTSSHTGYAFSAGGGASIHIAGALWADVDAKYFRLSSDRNTTKLGGGLGFRF